MAKAYCVFKKSDERKIINLGCETRTLSKRRNRIKKLIKNLYGGQNRRTQENYSLICEKLSNGNEKILIIGGGEIGNGCEILYEYSRRKNIQIEALDVYQSQNCTVIADAHYLPFADSTFDVVIIQAVLEHVVSPEMVVKELYRVLNKDGWVYSETPFLQAVHEGAYDFTRYTKSGHRWLFRSFEIDSGSLYGAFTSTLYIATMHFLAW